MDIDKISNIEKFRFICKDLPSPDLFIDFNFYFLISSCLARKVWIGSESGWQLFPNQFLWFVGPPGVGKSLPGQEASRILSGLTQIKKIKNGDKEEVVMEYLVNLSPNSTTWEKMIKRALDSGTTCKRIDNPEKINYYHSSTCFCLFNELGTLFRRNADDVGTFLTDGWDGQAYKNDTYKHNLQHIKNICINFLGCLTPQKMAKLDRQEILDEGLAARIIFLYSDKSREGKPALFYQDERQCAARTLLSQHLKNLCLIPASELKLSMDAINWIEDWHRTKSNLKLNRHPVLEDYYARKKQHIIKLAMCVHFADKISYEVTTEDLEESLKLLERAEVTMHEARATGGKNPLNELAEEIRKNIAKQEAITRSRIFLDHFKNGNELQINEALNYLLVSGTIEPVEVSGKAGFKIVKHEF